MAPARPAARRVQSIDTAVTAQVAAAEEEAWLAPEPAVEDILMYAPSWAKVTA
jgi:hypothetical protein